MVFMLCPRYLYNFSIKFLWDSHWVSMIHRWDYSGISNESKLKSIDQLNMSCNQLKVKLKSIETQWKVH